MNRHSTLSGVRRLVLCLAVSASPLFGCSSDDGPGDPQGGTGGAGSGGGDGGASAGLAAPCDPETKVGRFTVQLVKEADRVPYSQISGAVLDAVDPRDLWVEVERSGECALVVGPEVRCGTPCAPQVCAGVDLCMTPPGALGVGKVTAEGLAGPVEMMPNVQNTYYFAGASTLPFPPFAAGDPLVLRAEGAEDGPFSVQASGIAPLELTSTAVAITEGEPMTVDWAPPSGTGSSRIALTLDLAHHGGIAARVVCDVPDSGSATIPADLLTALVERGTAGFPLLSVVRFSVGSAEMSEGCVEFGATSSTALDVAVPGVESCQTSDDCTGGKQCLQNLTCG